MTEPVRILDLTGVPCPQNAARSLLVLMTMDTGELLEIVIDDGEPIALVPESIEDEGHTILSQLQRDDGQWVLRIEVD
jgi:TusA-related sulfurtransferase